MNFSEERMQMHTLSMALAKDYSRICRDIQYHLSEYDCTGNADHLLVATASANLMASDFAKLSGTVARVLKQLLTKTAALDKYDLSIEENIRNWILENEDKFMDTSDPCYGKLSEDEIYISSSPFLDFLSGCYVDAKDALLYLERKGILDRGKRKGMLRATRLKGAAVSCYVLRRDGIF